MHQMCVTASRGMWVMAVRQVSFSDQLYSQGLYLLLFLFSCV